MHLQRRHFFRTLIAAVTLTLSSWAFAGEGYTLIQPPHPTDNPAKIEVLEFFYYSCPHCNDLSVPLTAWVAKLPADVSFKRIPVTFGRAALNNLAKLYYSLEAMGELAKLDPEVFAALHKQRINLSDEKTMLEWLAKKGVNTQKFSEVYKSFGVESKVRRGDQITQALRIPGVPALVIDGKYQLDPNAPAEVLALADKLIAKARSEHGKK